MARRKKHKKKQRNHKSNEVKNTTVVRNQVVLESEKVSKKPNLEEIIESQTGESAVLSDVRYSLVLVGIIAVVFAVLFIALQNSSVANSVYGIIKLNNLSF